MKTNVAFLIFYGCNVAALPQLMTSPESPLHKAALGKRQVQGAGALPSSPPPFNATAQYVSNQGVHAFIPPGPTDARGPCPGLNAMANHGYIPRNGVASIQQFMDGTEAVFGMARDLSGFLAVFGSIIDGNGTAWSIGGSPHTGIGGSHNNYETDSSPLKGDLNQYGSNGRLIMEQFYDVSYAIDYLHTSLTGPGQLYNMQPNFTTANYNLEVMRAFRGQRYQESINKNPYFVYAPFTGIEVSQAAFTFIYRFMSNKSAANPEGILDKNTLKSFMSITGPENNLTWTFGQEQIPNNWYKRNIGDEYSIPYFQADILYFAETQPEIFNTGCNEGSVNSYNSISPQTLSGGVYTAQAVAANPLCFSAAFGLAELELNAGLNSNQKYALNAAFSAFTNALGVNCPAISNPNTTALFACPGFSTYGGPTGPVAPGAIQS